MSRALLSHTITACFLIAVGAAVHLSAAPDSPVEAALARDDPRRIHAETCQACRSSGQRGLPDVIDETWRADVPVAPPLGPEEPADSR